MGVLWVDSVAELGVVPVCLGIVSRRVPGGSAELVEAVVSWSPIGGQDLWANPASSDRQDHFRLENRPFHDRPEDLALS